MSVVNSHRPLLGAADVISQLAVAMPHLQHALVATQSLHDMGLDSLDLVELLCVIESKFNVRVTDDDLSSAATVGDLAALIAARRNEERKVS